MVRQDMEKAGFTNLAATMGLQSLLAKGMLRHVTVEDSFAETSHLAYGPTSKGVAWLIANKETLTLRIEPPKPSDEDIPF
jgi:hypothetical protein